MADKVVSFSEKSLAYHIKQNVSSFDNVYVITPDFDWNKKPDPSSPGNKTLKRSLPFAGVIGVNDITPPFSIGNVLYEQNILMSIHVAGSTYTEMKQLTAEMKQSLKTAVNPITNNIGIVLYNFDVVSGSFYSNAGTMQVEILDTQYFGPLEQSQDDNRKYKSVTAINLTAFKDSTATLLENKGRINLTDS